MHHSEQGVHHDHGVSGKLFVSLSCCGANTVCEHDGFIEIPI